MRQTGSTNARGGQHRVRRRRLQPYAWLGAGAVTLGVGAALVGGTGVAYADSNADKSPSSADSPSPGSKSTDSTSSSSSSAKSDSSATTKRTTARTARRSAASSSGGNLSARETSTQDTASAAAAASAGDTTGTAIDQSTATTTQATSIDPAPVKSRAAAQSTRVAVTTVTSTTTSVVGSPGAAVVLPAADPAPNMDSYLPSDQIVAGVAYDLGRQQLSNAQTALNQATWGSGNIVAGLVATVPQVMLASASVTLDYWAASNSGAQGFFASTANIPIIHQLAGGNLLVSMLLPSLAGAEMSTAALFLPLVDALTGGSAIDPVSNSVQAAILNTRVYGIVPVSMVATTEPVVYLSINGGPTIPVLVDTGSSGLVVTMDSVGQNNLGNPYCDGANNCTSGYSGGLTYHYQSYDTTVDFGNGIVTDTTAVNVVDQADEAAFLDFLSWGAKGILGIGANAYGPGPSVPTAALPGELSDGVMLYQGLFFGFAGLMVFGQNPMPVRTSVPGAPIAYLQVQVGNGQKTTVASIIDSGGVYGTLFQSLVGASSVAPGTKISVYSEDGSTLLYSYTTSSYNAPTVIPDSSDDPINTGYFAFQQGPVYINYAYDNPYGIGSTDFNYA